MTPQKRLGVMVAACLVLIQAMPLLASECYTLADILVTARGKDSSVCLTPGGTAVMESQDIFQAQDPSITNTLTQIPGVEKSSDSAWGSAVNIRGLGREQVVFLIDGTRVNTATDINARFGLINPNEIQRVEVLKGPISSLYGSGTMGGVINIITRKGTFSDQTRTSSTIGGSTGLNPQGFSAFGQTALNSKNFWIYAFGGRRDYDPYETGKGTVQDHSFFADDTLGLKSAVKWNPANLTQINIQYTK
ncbi:MAG: TonB-dependent receptor [Desulfobacter sp.]|nr:TonB-dependent receptor [Desulfobacter sp.]